MGVAGEVVPRDASYQRRQICQSHSERGITSASEHRRISKNLSDTVAPTKLKE
jgi:hypothetical protein